MKGESEGKQIAEDVSKYLYFPNSNEIETKAIVDGSRLNNYTTKLLDEGVGMEGVLTKLDIMGIFIDFSH